MNKIERFYLTEYQTDSFKRGFSDLCKEKNVFPPNPFTFQKENHKVYIDFDQELINKLDKEKLNELPFTTRFTLG